MITWKQLHSDEITDHLLHGYERYTNTTRIHFMENNTIIEKEIQFVDDWDEEQLQNIARYLRDCASRGGIVMVGIDQDRVIAFGNLDHKTYPHGYINMPYCHVTKSHRGQGLGAILFQHLERAAATLGGTKLYISAHPSIETQGFYAKVGCVLAEHIIPELYDKEPYDIQLEKTIEG